MFPEKLRATARLFATVLAVPISGSLVRADTADRVLDYIIENWRWSHYWSGTTGLEDVYVQGRKISALIFWATNTKQPVRGLCSADLVACVAYSGVHLDPRERRMQMTPGSTPQQALTSFIKSGLRDASHMAPVEGLRVEDFQTEVRAFTLPTLTPPTAVSLEVIPEEARREAERITRTLRCSDLTERSGCTGTLVFAYYGSADPYWFVLRTCSVACDFKGESVELLTRGDWGWQVTAGGFIRSPKKEVERLKQQIEKAEMFRFQIK